MPLAEVVKWRMGKSFQKYGGTGRKNQIEKWKKSNWEVERD